MNNCESVIFMNYRKKKLSPLYLRLQFIKVGGFKTLIFGYNKRMGFVKEYPARYEKILFSTL